ncbi:hypothetical protein [Agromyces seonyuensis]|uniref:hypothetical protein n=1 Tax=Agromyces seonyuensis TaxID=2662446 RepID=UPI001365E1C8|nr:hypothetical protein [Agromyces seonyuensis]
MAGAVRIFVLIDAPVRRPGAPRWRVPTNRRRVAGAPAGEVDRWEDPSRDSVAPRPAAPRSKLLVGLLVAGGLLVVGGAVLLAESQPAVVGSFGWFAYQPLSESVFVPMLLSPTSIAGWTCLGFGALVLAFAAGLAVGRRSRPSSADAAAGGPA